MKEFINLLHPFGLAWIALNLITLKLWPLRKEQRSLWRITLATWLVLTLTGWTSFPERLLASLERPWAKQPWEAIPTADALLFLGGGASSTPSEIIGLDMSNASDRITTAIELIRRGKAPILIAGGGTRPYTPAKPSEGARVEQLISNWNLSQVPIYQLGTCANTHEEALSLRKLTEEHHWKSILLVTSASHMRRAAATFRKQGLPIIPVACGFRSKANGTDEPTTWLSTPDAGKVELITIWLSETIGYAVYWLRGWV